MVPRILRAETSPMVERERKWRAGGGRYRPLPEISYVDRPMPTYLQIHYKAPDKIIAPGSLVRSRRALPGSSQELGFEDVHHALDSLDERLAQFLRLDDGTE